MNHMSDHFESYTYVLHHVPTGLKYYGYRKANTCAPTDDLWKQYFSSCQAVHDLRKQYGDESFQAQVRKTFKTGKEAYHYEQHVIGRLKLGYRSDWLNKTSGSWCRPYKGYIEHPPIPVETFDDWDTLRYRIRHHPLQKRTLTEILRSAPRLELTNKQNNEIVLYLNQYHPKHPETIERLKGVATIADLVEEGDAVLAMGNAIMRAYPDSPPTPTLYEVWRKAKDMIERGRVRGHNNTLYTLPTEF